MSKNLSFNKLNYNLIFKSDKLKAFYLILGTILLFFVAQFVGVALVALVLTFLFQSASEVQNLLTDNVIVQFLTILAIEIVTITLIYYVLKFKKKPLWSSVGLGHRPNIKHFGLATLAYFIYFIVLILTTTIMATLIPSLDINQPQQLGFESPQGYELVFVYASLVILPAFTEEVLFRGFLFQRLRNLINIKVSAVITSIVFAAAHLEFLSGGPLNWIAFLDTFVFSFFLIWLLVKTKSLWPSIFLHGIKNSIAFIALFVIQ